jgi:hypothetical protein
MAINLATQSAANRLFISFLPDKAVVGRHGLTARDFLAMLPGFEDCAPATGARIARAGAVRVDDHVRLRPRRHHFAASPYSLTEAIDW